ncbi:uncharacterized protein A4U43_C02F18370 [Asparagus officinalis]|uniref:AP2/ERF domain-containing protein n=1 Tax=Asparagus officinalis TaxID=4686 RepID=A0A5P1FN54_ASPOF|nr:uncharacterized protein A4U43_C02F18370 [Asparagus officinalis]
MKRFFSYALSDEAHRWTGRYEAHLWDKSTWNQNQNKKGKQVYLGAYDDEEAAARAYDLAALKYWGAGTLINFPVSDYTRDLEEMQMISKEDYLVSLRRKSSAFSRGFPKCRGVARQSQGTRWETSFGQMPGCTDAPAGGKYGSVGSFGMERKIDLTNYIRWWQPNKSRQLESEEDIGKDLRALGCSPIQKTEPYQLPSLGLPNKGKAHATPSLSACGILSKSVAFKNFVDKSSEIETSTCRNNEMDRGKSAVPLLFAGGSELDVDRSAGVTSGLCDTTVQRTPYTFSPIFSEPLSTSWNPVDPVSDPVLWSTLVPPTSQSITATMKKKDIDGAYSYQCQG